MSATDRPVDPNASLVDQNHQALTWADENGFADFLRVTPGKPSKREYVIRVNGVERTLPAWAVLPYVTGIADMRGAGPLFPPREGAPS